MAALSIHSLADFGEILQPPARLAALDIGTKTIGLALSTPDWSMTTPLTTIRRGKWTEDLKALDKAFNGFDVRGVVVGLPLNMDDSEGPQAQSVRQTVFNLIKAEPTWLSNAIIAFYDERLSTAAASEVIGQMQSSRKTKESGALDAVAAQIILDRALVFLKAGSF